MLIWQNKNTGVIANSGTNSAVNITPEFAFETYIAPNNPGALVEDYNFLALEDIDPRAGQIFAAGSYDLNQAGDNIVIFPRITVSLDKTSIAADGIDTATITAQVALESTEEIMITVDGIDYPIQAVGGIATFQVASTEPGQLTITARSSTKYGSNSVTLEVV